jgi:hypothetical protein
MKMHEFVPRKAIFMGGNKITFTLVLWRRLTFWKNALVKPVYCVYKCAIYNLIVSFQDYLGPFSLIVRIFVYLTLFLCHFIYVIFEFQNCELLIEKQLKDKSTRLMLCVFNGAVLNIGLRWQHRKIISSLFWDVTPRRYTVIYRRFGTTYRSRLQGSRSPRRRGVFW